MLSGGRRAVQDVTDETGDERTVTRPPPPQPSDIIACELVPPRRRQTTAAAAAAAADKRSASVCHIGDSSLNLIAPHNTVRDVPLSTVHARRRRPGTTSFRTSDFTLTLIFPGKYHPERDQLLYTVHCGSKEY